MQNRTFFASFVASSALALALASPAHAGKGDRAREAIAAAEAKIHTAETLGAGLEAPHATADARAALATAKEDLAAGHKSRSIETAIHASALADTAIGELQQRKQQAQSEQLSAAHAQAAAAQDQALTAQQQAEAAQQQAAEANARAEAAQQAAATSAADAAVARAAAATTPAQVETTVTTQQPATRATTHRATRTKVVRRTTTAPAPAPAASVTTTTRVTQP